MANFRAEVKPVSRAKGHNAVAAAAYRAGEELTDTNKYNPDAKTYDYSKKSDVMHKNIILPTSLLDQGFAIGRQELWSAVEQHEVTQRGQKMKANARVGREWLLSLPHELSDEENIALAEEFAQKMADDLGVIADCCIHNPKLSTKTKEDDRNIHAHIMFTTRQTTMTAAGELVLGDKADSELDGTARKAKGLAKETDYIKQVRSTWADMVNERLAKNDIALVSSLSYKDRNLDIVPTVKVHRGSKSSVREEYNDAVIERNELVFKSRVDTVKRFASAANAITDSSNKNLEYSKQRVEYSERHAQDSERRVEYSERQIETRASRQAIELTAPNPYTSRARARERAADALSESAIRDDYQERRHSSGIKELHEHAQAIKQELAWDTVWREKVRKFDSRQMILLNEFADKHDLNHDYLPYSHQYVEDRATMFTPDFIEQNKSIINLLRDPIAEREQYAQAQIDRSSQHTSQTPQPSHERERDWQPPSP